MKQFYIFLCLIFNTIVLNIYGEYLFHDPCKSEKYQSDIAIPIDRSKLKRRRRALTNEHSKIWEHAIIPYDISKSFTGKEKLMIHKAIQQWQEKTCLVFKRKTVEREHVIFRKQVGCGCCSFVGRMGGGKAQGINLDKNCAKYGTILHEIGHVVGFWHEHARPDRDLFLKIQTEHIKKEELKNFEKKSLNEIDSLGVPYDYESLMHYGKNTFAKSESKNSILPILNPNIQIGQRERLSVFDAKQTNLLYGCTVHQRVFTDPFGMLDYITDNVHDNPTNARIIAPEGHQILLYFRRLNFSSTCNKCQITLYDGNDVQHLYCRDKIPPNVFLSTSNHLSLRLTKNQQQSKACGYTAEYNILCGGNIYGDVGNIQSPRYPKPYDGNRICEWNIKVEEGHHIELVFELLKLERTANCDKDYIEIIDVGNNRHLGRFCRFRELRNLRIASNSVRLRFRSDKHNNKQGFSMLFYKVSNPCAVNNGGCLQICSPDNKQVKCGCYEGYILDKDRKHCIPSCNRSVSLIPGQQGKITIPYRTHSKFPIICQWLIRGFPGHSIILRVSERNVFQSADNVIEVYGIDFKNTKKRNSYRISHHNELLNLPFRTIFVKIFLKKNDFKNLAAATFYLERNECLIQNGGCHHYCQTSSTKAVCSCRFGYQLRKDKKTCLPGNSLTSMTSLHGEITSPDFPDYYKNFQKCQWDITTIPGHRTVIRIKNLEKSQSKSINQPAKCPLYLKDNMGGAKQALCKVGNIAKSQSHLSTVYFRQLRDQNFFKFNMTYTTECGGDLVATKKYEDIFSHIRFSKNENYPHKTSCRWRIKHNSKKYKILLNFRKFNLENEPCRFDYVTIYDGSNSQSPLIAKLCGSKLKEKVFISSRNEVYLTFVTDQSVSGLGFHLTYKRTKAKPTREVSKKKTKVDKHNFGRRRDFFVFDANNISSN